ncbi:predicted protein [Naegleria gruberi]|uniref:Predicted protein n=1 Tax=Naegleria gruberi TaxID=5762 RepID=D2V663_NAEGR|nr:uncharacterized protein NAEGRDRAFT_64323 [Naegleria gruberi]EFC47777.1 predicted protein [Naegleria gruberi]|eukprot:XP_002680521.1 predicted protein [Naegleria gruberi strain NEG-M]
MINIRLDYPQALFAHPTSGNIYFSDINNRRLFKYCPFSAELITLSDSVGTKSLYVTKDEQYLYFTSSDSHTIKLMDLKSGKVTIIAGMENVAAFNGDGKSALETSLFSPSSLIVFEEEKEIYFYDIQNHRVRKITSGGIVETVIDVGDYPTFKKNSMQINSCYGHMKFSQSRKFLYISNETYSLFRIDMETKEATCIFKKYALMNWYLTDDQIYATCYCEVVRIDIVNLSAHSIIDLNSKGEFKDIVILDNNTALIMMKYHENEHEPIRFVCCKLRLSDGNLHSTIIRTSANKQYEEPRKFFFVGNSAFNIPKLPRDTKIGNVIYFEPLLKKVAPILYKQIQQRQFDTDEIQYLVDYCIYHNYNDFKEVNSELMKGLQSYFKTEFDPIFKPLLEYIQKVSGMIPPSQEQHNKRRFFQKPNQESPNNEELNFTKNHLPELFNDVNTSDFSIFLNGNEWKCHKTILSKSKFFKTLTESSHAFSDKKENAFYMDADTNPTTAEIIIKYLYDIQPNVDTLSASDILELVQLSKLHELDSLGHACIQNLNITLNLFDPLAQFIEKYDLNEFPSLYQKLVQFALQNTHELLENIYGGELAKLPSFVLTPLLASLPQWAQFYLHKQLKQ